jgi:hypothetical protein
MNLQSIEEKDVNTVSAIRMLHAHNAAEDSASWATKRATCMP